MPAESEKTTVELRSAAWRRSSAGGLPFCGGERKGWEEDLILLQGPIHKDPAAPADTRDSSRCSAS
jgi:hypothetical protein